MNKSKVVFIVSPDAWCEHCGNLATGKCQYGHEAVGISAEDPESGIQWCPDCMAANGLITEEEREAAYRLVEYK